jgi:hypothetical protein
MFETAFRRRAVGRVLLPVYWLRPPPNMRAANSLVASGSSLALN